MKIKTKINIGLLLTLIIITNINFIGAADEEPNQQVSNGFTMSEVVNALIELEKVIIKDDKDKYECNAFECCVVYDDKEKNKDKEKDKCVELKSKIVKIK